MSTQLRLVDTPEAPVPARRARKPQARPRTRRARTTSAPTGTLRWDTDWRLDPAARRAGRQGVAGARAALARARRPDELPRAS